MQSTRSPLTLRTRRGVALTAGIALLASVPVAAVGTAAPHPSQVLSVEGVSTAASVEALAQRRAAEKAVTVPRNVKLYQTRDSILGVHKWYRQYRGTHVVVGGWWGWHRDKDTGEITVWDGRKSVGALDADEPRLGLGAATGLAAKASTSPIATTTHPQLMVLPTGKANAGARLVWAISSADGQGARTSYVDAATGTVLKTARSSTFGHSPKLRPGNARVFDPNPVQKLQDQSLRDRNNSRTAVTPRAYSHRTLAHLTGKGHTLDGRWVTIVNKDRATSTTRAFNYNRSNPYFEQTMAYYAIDTEQSYLQRLGFTDVNAEPQAIKTNAFTDDNSYYDTTTDMISTGTGGVDDAEDPEVVWHEYGHAVQYDQIPAWGHTFEGSAIGEAFGDYMAVTMSQRFSRETAVAPLACVMDWDATSYTGGSPHCLRRTDRDLVYTGARLPGNDPHLDGQIWSRALWDINQAIGRNHATTIIVESTFWMHPLSRFKSAARVTVATAQKLYPDDPAIAAAVQQAFADREILAPPT
jgi:hypothetical protein